MINCGTCARGLLKRQLQMCDLSFGKYLGCCAGYFVAWEGLLSRGFSISLSITESVLDPCRGLWVRIEATE